MQVPQKKSRRDLEGPASALLTSPLTQGSPNSPHAPGYLNGEAAWLVRVHKAYSEITTAQTQQLLARAEEGLVA
jgi:hypothetical protein